MLANILNIGTILSTEKDAEKLYEIILKAAMDFTHSDAGILYRLLDDKQLSFDIIHTRSKGVYLGGKSGQPINTVPIDLFLPSGAPDYSTVVSNAVHNHETVQVEDVYASTQFDFSSIHAFDKQNDYQSRAVLIVPLRKPEGEIIGALQLLNPLGENGAIRAFTHEEQTIVRSLASQMVAALANRTLFDTQAAAFNSMTQLINSAIDDRQERLMLANILDIGTILSTEKDAEKLNEIILKAAMDFTHSDAGTLYRLLDDKQLSFDIIHTRSKGVHLGGKSGHPITLAPIELFLPDGTADHSKIVCHAVHAHETV